MPSLHCSCGNRFSVEHTTPDAAARCPECGCEIPVDDAAKEATSGRGLWDVMGRAAPVESSSPGPAAEPATRTDTEQDSEPDRPRADDPENVSSREEPQPRGLWAMMQQARSAPAATPPAAPHTQGTHSSDEQPPGEADLPETPEARDTPAKDEPQRESALPAGEPVELRKLAGAPARPVAGPLRTGLPAIPETAEALLETAGTPAAVPQVAWYGRREVWSLLASLVALPLAGLASLPGVWFKLPATVTGFAGLALGLIAWNSGARRRRMSLERGLAAGGIVLGLVAMFLGPLVFSGLGRRARTSADTKATFTHLEQVGQGLVQFHDARGRFPPGGVFAVDGQGQDVAMHGWMTQLLPWVGEEQLARSIEQDVPWSHPRNEQAMSQVVPAFLAGDQPARQAGRNYAPTHFAGVGGDTIDDRRGLVRLGIFGRNSKVTREDVTDGLSTTLVAGEISTLIPAWGDPSNWRTVGRGLNRELTGFGNAAKTGAMFLRADGSVRFYSRQTDPEVLRRLSTRNGQERIAREHQ